MNDTPRTDTALCRLDRAGGVVIDLVPYGQIVRADFSRGLERENALLRAWVKDAAARLDDAADDNTEHWASDESKKATIEKWAANLREALATLS